MYNRQIKIFLIITGLFLFGFILRLVQMQLLSNSFYRDRIGQLELQSQRTRQFKTVRGRILDRNGRELAVDEPRFQLHIDYSLTSFMDDRVRRSKLLIAADKDETGFLVSEVEKTLYAGLSDLQQIVSKCAQFRGVEPAEVESEIQRINDLIWSRRAFQAWRRKFPNSEVFENYESIISIPINVAIADFEKKQPDPNEQLRLINKVDIAEMHKTWPLLDLITDDDIFTAQLEFSEIEGVQILAKPKRSYPFSTSASQTIGWVGPATQQADKELFADDQLLRYLDDEVCGREDGVEYVCETILRGRRGRVVYDIDHELVDETKAEFGGDVSITLDIELQKRIEDYLASYEHEPNCGPGMAVVIIEVSSGDILALVSMPVFDLNRIRYNYSEVANDPNGPLRNRAINKNYPPGSVVKPLILIAGLESGKITADEVISCPAEKAPSCWPSCWLYNMYRWRCHDDDWLNTARNAVRGSCNIYFSRLADRIEPEVLQRWLYNFGYGRKVALIESEDGTRSLRETSGQISTRPAKTAITSFDQVPPLAAGERRYFGIGQGNLRVSPLQAANAIATIARGGLYKNPRLFISHKDEGSRLDYVSLDISPATMDVVRDGMRAVVSEPGGTAYSEFAHAGFAEQGVTVYGKTGSTEGPENAWFGGFAEDSKSRSVAIAVVVEGGQHGSSDAAPLARNIIQFCIEAGYIGQN